MCVFCGFSCFVSSWLLNRDLLLSSDHDLGILTELPENNSSDKFMWLITFDFLTDNVNLKQINIASRLVRTATAEYPS